MKATVFVFITKRLHRKSHSLFIYSEKVIENKKYDNARCSLYISAGVGVVRPDYYQVKIEFKAIFCFVTSRRQWKICCRVALLHVIYSKAFEGHKDIVSVDFVRSVACHYTL